MSIIQVEMLSEQVNRRSKDSGLVLNAQPQEEGGEKPRIQMEESPLIGAEGREAPSTSIGMTGEDAFYLKGDKKVGVYAIWFLVSLWCRKQHIC
jgi:hypothetical protein